MRLFRTITALSLLAGMAMYTACMPARKVAQTKPGQEVLADRSRDWLRYEIYRLPDTKGNNSIRLSIRVINTRDNTSPLRRVCTNLEDYNTCYEYLLNRAKNDIWLESRSGARYPVYYAFENNYNAFPFETINLGYSCPDKKHDYRLVFVDRVFARDTLVFPLPNLKK